MLLIDHRENDKLIHKLLVKLGDADKNPKGQARILQLKSGDYVLGDWGIEGKKKSMTFTVVFLGLVAVVPSLVN